MSKGTALVIIDVQRGLVEGFESDWTEALENIATLPRRARAAGVTVIHVQHGGGSGDSLEVGSDGWKFHPAVEPALEGELVIHKRWSDAFVDTTLANELEARGIGSLIVAGAQTEYCVDATVRRAASLGYDVTLVADGHTTSTNGILTRSQIIAHHNRTLTQIAVVGPSITALPVAEVRFSSETPT